MVYEYTRTEQILMAIITGLSNITSLPITLLCYRKHNIYVFALAIFSMITSFLYHVCESLDIALILKQMKWHELDNIGAICSLNSLILVLTHYHNDIPRQNILNYLSLFMTLIFQQRGPWDLINTFLPIIIYGVFAVYDCIKHGMPKYNYQTLWYGGFFLIGAIAMFIRGLDDLNDYLRMYHSLWHVLIGISTFYLWQIQEKTPIAMKTVLVDAFKGALTRNKRELI